MFFSWFVVAFVMATAATLVKARTESGEGTWYQTGLGACGITNVNTDFIVAASHAMFDSFSTTSPGDPNTNTICNLVIKITYGGVTAYATITDRCAGCSGFGDIDMAPSLFAQFAPLSIGRLYNVKWSFN